MTTTQTFSIVGMIAMPMWVLMIFLPKWSITKFFMKYQIIPLMLSLVYAVYIFKAIQIGGMMDFSCLKSVMLLFTEENATLAGWVHYLAFDLLLGMWMLKQNEKIGIHQILMAPCLLGTFIFGPLGFLLFMSIKTIKQK